MFVGSSAATGAAAAADSEFNLFRRDGGGRGICCDVAAAAGCGAIGRDL